MKTALIICLSLSLLGCSTFKGHTSTFIVPPKPKTTPIKWGTLASETNTLYYLTAEQTIQLLNNIDEMKAYIEKMNVLVKTMAQYYDAKLEEYK